jgi:hypothetical protein
MDQKKRHDVQHNDIKHNDTQHNNMLYYKYL